MLSIIAVTQSNAGMVFIVSYMTLFEPKVRQPSMQNIDKNPELGRSYK